MAAELSIPGIPRSQGKTKVRVYVADDRRSIVRRLFFWIKIVVLVLVVATGISSYFIYNSYLSFAEIIDHQIAGGFLRGHAGLYAAPRVIEKGARLSKEQLVNSLQRAGYPSQATSNIWSGSFSQNGDTIRVLPRQNTEQFEWVDITFAKQDHVSSLVTSNGSTLDSYSLEAELLTDDT